jgi:exopolyphosphatase/guanosine-5'-triphosphate,3'-diphosphate pyrophosphatase
MPRYAAVDIGSNSTRMLAAEISPGEAPRTLASEREVTRLGESVFRTGRISPEAMDGVLRVLARMAETYRKLGVSGVRVVATSAVRDAANQADFVTRAGSTLGVPVEIITGREEARLIHQGVIGRWPQPGKTVLIVDIGGGSAEIIASRDGQLIDAVSKPLGAVRLQENFLTADPPHSRALHQLAEFVDEKLDETVISMGTNWDRVIATSSTAAAVVCAINELPRSKRDDADRLRVTTVQVRQLYRRLAALNLEGRRKVPGIGPRRAEIIVAGAGALLRIMERFGAQAMYYSAAGVRDGILADLAALGASGELSGMNPDQLREVERVASRFGVALPDARTVAGFAKELFHATHGLHQLPLAHGRLLEAACYFCDTGHYINDAAHHKHAYYVVAYSDFSGFTDRERRLTAALCRYHRKAMPQESHPEFAELALEDKRALMWMIPLLRLADNLDPNRSLEVQWVGCEVGESRVVVKLRSPHELDLTEWAAARVSEVFRQVYGRSVVVNWDAV